MTVKSKAGKGRGIGHRFERIIMNLFKLIGFKKVRTSREASRLMDNLGVDLINLPFYVQCKKGYAKGFNYSKFFLEAEQKIKEEEVELKPLIIFHSTHRGKESNKLVIMQEKDFFPLIKTLRDHELI